MRSLGPLAIVWVFLVDLEWGDPFDTDHSPEALLIHSDKTESLQSHLSFVVCAGWIFLFVTVEELVGWNPSGPCASILPEVLVVDGLSSGHLNVVLNIISSV